MIPADIQNILYIVASILFILGLKMLSRHKSARRGNFISAIGMLLAIVTVLAGRGQISWVWIIVGLLAGSLVGLLAARLVKMTAMPEMVALFNGSGGIASLLVGWAEYSRIMATGEIDTPSMLIISITVLIGGLTFTGSVIAWGKLSEKMSSKAIIYPGQKFVNAIILLLILAAMALNTPLSTAIGLSSPYPMMIVLIILSAILGITSVVAIGGGDMPVVISLLNSYSGMAACAAGFVVNNNVLIVAGALVGSSGIILTNIMCKAMNRSLANVLFSGFGSGQSSAAAGASFQGEAKPILSEDLYYMLEAADNVLFVPGYGMAVAQAQHVVRELAEVLERNDTEVSFGIHPVAGRMPGHMNVLLAEANVPYEQLKEMDDVNPIMEAVDVAIVIGANDVVNPAAREAEGSPLYGMPIINVDLAKTVIILKRSLNPGFAGVDNPLFFKENARMFFGDAKQSLQKLLVQFKEQ